MAEKTINTRILLKYDSYTNWSTNNPVLKAGEMAIATIASGNTQEVNSVAAPQVLIKVGDGTSTYNALPFVSAKAADVYGWAKADKKPTYAATEITGIGDYIAQYVDETLGISVDTDTQYRITKVDDYNYKLQSKAKGEADTAFADVSTIVIPKYDDTAVKADITELEKLVGTTAVATQITNALATYALKSELPTKVSDLTNDAGYLTEHQDISGKVDKVTGKSLIADSEITRLAGMSDGANKVEKSNTNGNIKVDGQEVTVYTHPAKHEIADVTGLQDALDGKQAVGDYATKAEAQGYANAKDTAIAQAKKAGDDAQSDVDALETVVAGKADKATTLAGYGIGDAYTKTEVDEAIETEINTFVSAYITSDGGAIDKMQEIANWIDSDKDGAADIIADVEANADAIADLETEVAKKTNDADLAAIAKTGNVNDLVQTSGDVLIFDCGNSSF